MRVSPFLIFALVVILAVGGVITFIQSAKFAQVVKMTIARYAPADLGIAGDFEGLQIKLFPPGISIREPKLRLLEHNVVGLPAGSRVDAQRLDLEFRPMQIFSGNIRVHEVSVVGGRIDLKLGDLTAGKKNKKKGFRPDFHWDELLQIHAEAISLSDTHLHVEAQKPEFSGDLTAERLRVGQWSGPGGLGYEVELGISAISGTFLNELGLPVKVDRIDRVSGQGRLNAAGLQIDHLALAGAGTELHANGTIKGNVFSDPKGLVLESEVEASTDLALLLAAIRAGRPHSKSVPAATGKAAFRGKLQGALGKLDETLRLQGELSGASLKFDAWAADSLRSEVLWQAGPHGGDVSLSKGEVRFKELPRTGGLQAGSGGRIEIGAFKFSYTHALGISGQGLMVPLKLDRVHVHSLAGPALKKVFALDLRASGPVSLSYRPATENHAWELQSKVALDVEGFQLDNQRLEQVKPLHKILSVPKVKVEGPVSVDSAGVHFTGMEVSTGQTVFKGGGKVDFKTGLDLLFHGQVDLENIGQIAENDIRGKGSLKIHAHGPTSRILIDFDTGLKDAEYLRLKLGDVDGRVTWNDEVDQLIFTALTGHRGVGGATTYQADGVIDVSKGKDTISLGILIPHGQIQDLTPIFERMTDDLWWYPRELHGTTRGDLQLTGGLGLDRLVITTRLTGEDWEQWGERFSTVTLAGGYDRGRFHISEFRGAKRKGSIIARISYDKDHGVDWGLHSEMFTVADLDHLSQLDVPMRGSVSIESSGKGKVGEIKSATDLHLRDFAVRGALMPPSDLSIKSGEGKAEVHGIALGGQGELDALYDFGPTGMSRIKAELKQLDFTPLVLLVNSKLIQDRALLGRVSGELNLTFKSGEIERANGLAELTEYSLGKTGSQFKLAQPIRLKISDGSFDLLGATLRGNQGEATLSLRSRRGDLEGRVEGDVDLSIAEFVTAAVADADGVVNVDLALGGRIKSPSIFGRATLEGAGLKIPALESPVENITGTLQLRQNVISVQNLQGDLAGGRVSTEGTVQLFADRYPEISLKTTLTGNKLKIPFFQFVKVRGGLHVHGNKLPYLLDGDILVDSALSTEKILSQKKSGGAKALRYTPPPTSSRSSDYPLFKLNIGVVADGGIIIQNDLFDAEAKGKLTVVNTLEAPRLLGTAEIISGKMLFKDRVFQVQSASANFDNPTVLNPSFNLTSATDVNGMKIQLYVSGRIDNWKPELTSNPVMPESEILSLLALGVTSSDAKRMSATDRTVFEQGEAASLLLNSLDFNREVQSKTGLQIKLDESVSLQQQGVSVFKPQSGTDSIAQPKIVIKRQIGKQFDLSYGTTVGGTSASAQKEVNAEYHFTPGFSVMGVWDNYETIDTQDRTSIGLDLKFQKRFK